MHRSEGKQNGCIDEMGVDKMGGNLMDSEWLKAPKLTVQQDKFKEVYQLGFQVC